MKSFRKLLIVLLLSIFLTALVLILFKPVLLAENLTFPYSIYPFNIAKTYPKTWFYIKLIYCFTSLITNFLILNSIRMFFKFNPKSRNTNNLKDNKFEDKSSSSLLIGVNSTTQENVIISEKGLYQNILVTGTIGSRQNKFCYVPIIKSTDEI